MNMQDWNEGKMKFTNADCVGPPYDYIHPYKQDAVQFFVENRPDWVTHIIVFGSAVTTAHLWYKDLDLCLIGECNEDNLSYKGCKIYEIDYDILRRRSLEHLFESARAGYPTYRDIIEKGVMVYG